MTKEQLLAIKDHEVARAEMDLVMTKLSVGGADAYDEREYMNALARLSETADAVYSLLKAA
jgi:hypothetical protein